MPQGESITSGAKPPSLGRLLRELADVPATIAARLLPVRRLPATGQGQPVLVLPGFLANDDATSLLRRSIDAAGLQSFGWEMGFNVKVGADMIERLNARLEAVSAAAGGARVTLVGWSLGGLYARQLANEHPDKVRMVVSLGSPFSGDLRANNAWRLIEATNGHAVDNLPMPIGFREKPPVHTIAVWSPNDGIVAPETSCGDPDQSDERIELACTHMGFCVSASGVRGVVQLLLDRLAN